MASTLPSLRRSSRIASSGGWTTAREIASHLESSVKKLAALEPADIQKMNRWGWVHLGSVEHAVLPHMLSADGFYLLDAVFYDYYYYCNALFYESPQLLAPAAEKLKDLLVDVLPAAVLPEHLPGATYCPPPAYVSPPETLVAEEPMLLQREEDEESWLQYSARKAQEMIPADSEDDYPDFCRGCSSSLETYQHTYCYDCVNEMDEEYKQKKMDKKERCHSCHTHFSVAPSGRITCGCDDY